MFTKREKHLLKVVLNFSMHRYIMCNMQHRLDGAERADQHIFISKMICHFLLGKGGFDTIRRLSDEYPQGWKEVHDWIAHNITDKMDETIGFAIDRPMYGEEITKCVDRFYELIWKNIDILWGIVYKADNKDDY